ncbi:hypothetical protein [Marinobacter xestospongiae]|uniref:Uncharacterized protein n=1 Tax=Marinobacter xestospongiae TaxID=994319 RepID=A0ABU3W3F8_9GAMM|nr:hypothetical protein [Marinobacter xestospongiae]MDV2081075.1 hypothetical protein [Marinobacter xestospongiae]
MNLDRLLPPDVLAGPAIGYPLLKLPTRVNSAFSAFKRFPSLFRVGMQAQMWERLLLVGHAENFFI